MQKRLLTLLFKEGDLLTADYTKGDDNLTITVVKGGVLVMPKGASEALDLKEDVDVKPKAKKKKKKSKKSSQRKIYQEKSTSKKDDKDDS